MSAPDVSPSSPHLLRGTLTEVLWRSGALGPLALVALVSIARFPTAVALGLPLALAFAAAPHQVLTVWQALVHHRAVALGAVLAALGGATALLWRPAGIDAVMTLAAAVLPVHLAVQQTRVLTWLAAPCAPTVTRSLTIAGVAQAVTGWALLFGGVTTPMILRPGFSVAAGGAVAAIAGALALAGTLHVAWRVFSAGRGRAAATVALAGVSATAVWAAAAGVAQPALHITAAELGLLFAGPLVLGHSVQLLAVAREATARVAGAAGRPFDGLAWWLALVVVGAVVLQGLPFAAARALAGDPTTVALAIQGPAFLLHALLDLVVWRGNGRALVGLRLAEAPLPSGQQARAQTSTARALAVAVPGMLLFAVAQLDVVQGLLLQPDADEHSLALAERLQPHDVRLAVVDAHRAAAAGDLDTALQRLKTALAGRVYAPDAQRLLFSVCMTRGGPLEVRGAERVPCSSALPPTLLQDVDVLLTESTAARRAGALDRAGALLAQAEGQVPGDARVLAARGVLAGKREEWPAAHRLIAQAVDVERARTGGDPLVDNGAFLEPGLVLAEAAFRDKDARAARDVLNRVLTSTAIKATPWAALRALGDLARIDESEGRSADALLGFQRALYVGAFAAEPAYEALLWIDYGSLLRRSAAPLKARYVCLLAADRELARLPDGADRARLNLIVRTAAADLVPLLEPADKTDAEQHLDDAVGKVLTLKYAGPAQAGATALPAGSGAP